MLIIRDITLQTEGEWKERTIWGMTVRTKIRPRNEELTEKIRNRHKRIKKQFGMEIPTYNEEKIAADLAEHDIEDFEGFGVVVIEDGKEIEKPMDVTPENKVKIMDMPVPPGELTMRAWIYQEAAALAVIAKEEETKNSGTSSSTDSETGQAPENQA